MTASEIINAKTERRLDLIGEADSRRLELHRLNGRIRELDSCLEAIPLRMLGGESAESLKAEARALNAERADILKALGFPADYDEPRFDCPVCKDSGYTDELKLCECVKRALSSEKYIKSPLASGLSDKSFENFSLSYYDRPTGERQKMEDILNGCRSYAESFATDNSSGLVFIGGTGLGKTHLSAAVANRVAEKGYSVVYESAQQIFDTLDAVRFNRADISERKKYESCALLVIDDLGAECITQYSVSAITSLIDLRIVSGKKTVISTNLAPALIKKTYGERLLSRLLGEFRVLQFVGRDIRMQKLQGDKA